MRVLPTLLTMSMLSVVGCSTGPAGSTPADHPASPDAAAMPVNPAPSSTSDAVVPSSSTQASAVYTCPMHADVTSDEPGTCPKCGMTLVKKGT